MTSYSWPLQQAVFAALNAAALPGVTQVIDHPLQEPADADYPYVELADSQSIADDTSCADGSEEYFDVHVWSRYRGKKEARQIVGAVHGAFNVVVLTVPGLASAHAFIDGSRILDDPDGLTRHGIVTLRVLCRKEN